MEALVSRLKSVRPQKWWLHESVFSHKLGIKPKEGLSTRDQLTSFLTDLKKGYTGQKDRGNNKVLSCGQVDLADAWVESRGSSRGSAKA